MENLYLPVFETKPGVTGFFSTAAGCSPRSPYYNRTVLDELGLHDVHLIWPEQVHGDTAAVIQKNENGFLTDENGSGYRMEIQRDGLTVSGLRIPSCDAVITDLPGVLLTTVHADCIPVCLYDPVRRVIGTVHAGWRGTAQGIGRKAVRKMETVFGSRPGDVCAWIGPGISKCCFEIGEEVREAFLQKFDWTDEFAERRNGSLYLDLKGINKRQLWEIGVNSIEISPFCTCCNTDFCSYRREKGTRLRMGAGLCLTER